jgi:tetratricopeptide (TPR) repeat protein
MSPRTSLRIGTSSVAFLASLALALAGCAQKALPLDRVAHAAPTPDPTPAAVRARGLVEGPQSIAAGTSTTSPAASPADAAQFQRSYDEETAGKLETALSALDDVVASERTGTTGYVAQLRRGWLLYRLGKHADSVKAYAKASALDPGSIEARVGALVPLGELRRWVDVEAMAREIVRKDPGNYAANLRLAFALYSQLPPAERVA